MGRGDGGVDQGWGGGARPQIKVFLLNYLIIFLTDFGRILIVFSFINTIFY